MMASSIVFTGHVHIFCEVSFHVLWLNICIWALELLSIVHTQGPRHLSVIWPASVYSYCSFRVVFWLSGPVFSKRWELRSTLYTYWIATSFLGAMFLFSYLNSSGCFLKNQPSVLVGTAPGQFSPIGTHYTYYCSFTAHSKTRRATLQSSLWTPVLNSLILAPSIRFIFISI